MKIALVSLGCPRNLVDSEVMAGLLKEAGHSVYAEGKNAETIIVNTCAFVESARRESIGEILAAVDLKKRCKAKYLVVAGCLAQGYRKDLAEGLSEVDAFIGSGDYHRVVDVIARLGVSGRIDAVSERPAYLAGSDAPRHVLTPRHYAYLKISEGCSNCCSYCSIPRLRGIHRSRRLASLLDEAKRLVLPGVVKEIDVIGQDTTLYGRDLYGKARLDTLLGSLASMEGSFRWIRLLYTHPAHFTRSLIHTIARHTKICKYIDLPIQHASDPVLKRMGRRVTKKDLCALIGELRGAIPGVVLRTSLIVGFPGETDRQFKELLDFVREVRFERLGAFVYSREEKTRAARFERQVEEKVKRSRFDMLMSSQQQISREYGRSLIGKIEDVLVDENNGPDGLVGRTYRDAPEIDGVVHMRSSRAKPGEFVRVRITDALEYDLVGDIV